MRVGWAHTPRPVMGRLTPGLSAQRGEARLLEVLVVGERLGDVPLLYDEETCGPPSCATRYSAEPCEHAPMSRLVRVWEARLALMKSGTCACGDPTPDRIAIGVTELGRPRIATAVTEEPENSAHRLRIWARLSGGAFGAAKSSSALRSCSAWASAVARTHRGVMTKSQTATAVAPKQAAKGDAA